MKLINLNFVLFIFLIYSSVLLAESDPGVNNVNFSSLNEKERESLKSEEVSAKRIYNDKYSRTIQTPENLFYRVAPDRPIEKYASYQGPIGLDSYIYIKSKELETLIDNRFSALEYRMTKLEETIGQIKTALLPKETALETSTEPAAPENSAQLL